ncbi:CCA tRNA nucleotidyltransferase [Actibacterium sp.]|uniref:CCA tRNA nucleotidyltransferase n=1 Tax=Actibacterium sp. TaxID=1872125 RepID=UPI00356A7BBB
MRITEDWIAAPETQAVCAMLTDAGYQALFVGGCVRNALLGSPVNDIDIATDALPETVVELATRAGLTPVPTGVEHGTVTVVSAHVPHEVTTFRKDVETDGRRAVVAFSDSAEQDAHRRDFTMNALYAAPDGQIIDPLGGLADLTARRVRFIDDASQRIREDYLRILRFFRFHAWYGDPAGGIDPDGLASCATLSAGIETLSRERVGAEMKKLLGAPDPAPSVAAMVQAGVLAHVLPGADARALPVLVHLEQDSGLAPDAIRRLALLGGQGAETGLRLSRAEAHRLTRLRDQIGAPENAAALGYRLGPDEGRDVLFLRAALFETPLPGGYQAELARGHAAVYPVKAADLMPQLRGPDLGACLKRLEQTWIDSDFSLTKAELLKDKDKI